mmetsp:Transcript_36720/g.92060  ORF Transcript_36720/g.92060 Transcript_36720/m.92060 type:complete len:98 (+) Transcript_36720:59-352(+)
MTSSSSSLVFDIHNALFNEPEKQPTGLTKEQLNSLPSSVYRGKAKMYCPIAGTRFVSRSKVTALPCFHVFTTRTIRHWLRKHTECPVCRAEVPRYIG